jgi:hypothetical protein
VLSFLGISSPGPEALPLNYSGGLIFAINFKAAFGCNQNGCFEGVNGRYNQMAISQDRTAFGYYFSPIVNGH